MHPAEVLSAVAGKPSPPACLLRDLTVGTRFRFADRPAHIWVSRGAGFYASPEGYDGGPSHCDDNPWVLPG